MLEERNIRIHISDNIAYGDYCFSMGEYNPGGVPISYELIIKTHQGEENTPIPDACMHRLSKPIAQMIMDELWRLGVRPHNGESSMAHTGALKYHLEDMRKIAFRSLESKTTQKQS